MNWIDITVIGIVGASAVVSLLRGFTKEVLTFAGWIGAVLIAIYGLPIVQPSVREIISSDVIADAVAGIALFVAAAFVLGLITHLISKAVHGIGLGAIDRSLGVVFGVARGAVFVILAFLLADLAIDEEEPPETLTEARTLPFLEAGAAFMLAALPEAYRLEPEAEAGEDEGPMGLIDPEALGLSDGEEDGEAAEGDTILPRALLRNLRNQEGEAGGEEPSDPGYEENERQALDRLIETTE